MSNISRRQFLKSAGVAALAVAALTGCKKIPNPDIPGVPDTPDVPDVPGVTSGTVEVRFTDDAGKVLATDTLEILKGKTAVYFGEISLDNLPKGYGVLGVSGLTDVLPIKQDGNVSYVVVNIKKGEVINAEDKDDSEITEKYISVVIWEQDGSKCAKWYKVLTGERVCYDDIKYAVEADFPGKTALNPAWRCKIIHDASTDTWAAEVPLYIG